MDSWTKNPPMVWMDVETTGLDPELDLLLEIAVVITGDDLEPHAGYEGVFGVRDFGPVGPIVWRMHTENGLFDECRQSRLSYAEADLALCTLFDKVGVSGKSPLCGSSVHFDRSFMKKFLPQTHQALHYRNIDVSSFKELALRWSPASEFQKHDHHRAMPDILESIRALRHYRRAFGL